MDQPTPRLVSLLLDAAALALADYTDGKLRPSAAEAVLSAARAVQR